MHIVPIQPRGDFDAAQKGKPRSADQRFDRLDVVDCVVVSDGKEANGVN